MKIAFLTSSRADFGIYLPLLKAMRKDPFFDLHIIAFGTHLSSFHGHTVDDILGEGFTIDHRIETVMASDTAESIATSMAITSMKFAAVWQREQGNYDLVFCLGDRYEMFAAVSAATPFGIKFAHIHGGETTLGSIDNQFRHCLSIFSAIHFTSIEQYSERVKEITGSKANIHTVGALGLDNLKELTLLSADQFRKKYQIGLSRPFILVTYHPQTVQPEANKPNAEQLVTALENFKDFEIIITMPNADTTGNSMRRVYTVFASENNKVHLVENFGPLGYFSCMALCRLVVGNSSSGIIEAASLKKYVVNIGDRQKGRSVSDNVIQAEADSASIIRACRKALNNGEYKGENIYFKQSASDAIIEVLKKWK